MGKLIRGILIGFGAIFVIILILAAIGAMVDDDTPDNLKSTTSKNGKFNPPLVEVKSYIDDNFREKYFLQITAQDDVTIYGIKVNRGNCVNTRYGSKELVYGQSIKEYLKCAKILEAEISTNYGDYTYDLKDEFMW